MARPCLNDRPMTQVERNRRYRARVKARNDNFIVGDEWGTPEKYIRLVRDALGVIDLDPASNEQAQRMVQARQYFTREDNGLTRTWTGRVFLNPPYSRGLINEFVDKVCAEFRAGNVTEAIVLTHSRTGTKWFRKLVDASLCHCNAGRIPFVSPDGMVGNSPRDDSTFFYLGADWTRFIDVFQGAGPIMWTFA